MEKIESKTGRVINNQDSTSRLSKRSFYARFLNLQKQLPNMRDEDDTQLFYSDAKSKAVDYQVGISFGVFNIISHLMNCFLFKIVSWPRTNASMHSSEPNLETGRMVKNRTKSIVFTSMTIFSGPRIQFFH